MKKNRLDGDIILGSLICIIPMLIGIVFYKDLPDTMAIHFSQSGEANGFASKYFIVFIMPVLFAVLNIIVNLGLRRRDTKEHSAKGLQALGKWIVPPAAALTICLTFYQNLKPEENIVNSFILILIGSILIISGNYFPKNHPNSRVGIKFPWLLKHEEAWNKTHRLSSRLWIIAGLLLLITPFIGVGAYAAIIAALILSGVLPLLYSLYAIRDKK